MTDKKVVPIQNKVTVFYYLLILVLKRLTWHTAPQATPGPDVRCVVKSPPMMRSLLKFMAITKIISSGTLGAESAALDVAIRFHISYGGYTNQGSLLPGDRPAGRYTLDEKPFVNPMVLLRANLEQSDGILIFSSGPVPPNVTPILPHIFDQNHPHLHIDFSTIKPHPAAFRIGTWVSAHALSHLFITGASLQEDRGIYQLVHDALTSFFMLGTDPPMPLSSHTLH